ncbi:MAG: hypothetical protein V7609_1847 [Verrucomicrobiota bacterium]
MNTEIIQATVGFTGVILLWIFWYYCWKPYTLDRFRQDLFDLRDDLFYGTANGKMPTHFDSVFYRETREDLNKMIRFAHEAKLANAILMIVLDRGVTPRALEKSKAARDALTEEERSILAWVDERQEQALTRYLMTSSPALWVILALGFIPVFVIAMCRSISADLDACRAIFKTELISIVVDQLEYQAGQRNLLGPVRALPC